MKNKFLLGQQVIIVHKNTHGDQIGKSIGFVYAILSDKSNGLLYSIASQSVANYTETEIMIANDDDLRLLSVDKVNWNPKNNKFWIGERVCVTRVIDQADQKYVGKQGEVTNISGKNDFTEIIYDFIDADGTEHSGLNEEELAQYTGQLTKRRPKIGLAGGSSD